MDVPLVEFVTSAEELIERLRPTAARWAPNPGDWIFRGQRDSRWGLLPAAFRPVAWVPFAKPGEAPFNPETAPTTSVKEGEVLRRFLDGLDRSGLDVPNDIFVRTHIGYDAHLFLRFPLEPATLVFVALAAHHGLPTRLLDWSRVAMNAAYFAAADAAKHEAKEPGPIQNLSVWAFRTEFARLAEDLLGNQNSPGVQRIRVATAPRASNANMHAQSGLFTETERIRVAPVEQLVVDLLSRLEHDGGVQWPGPSPLLRFDLPTSEASKLLRLLSYEQVDGARMFPGRDGVVKSLKEFGLWDRGP